MPREFRFSQVDVFSARPLLGNPLAVVHDAADLSDDEMARLARWTNLSETTFLLPPTDPAADYRLRIFTPVGELPFAGHPTLGSCHAWLGAGGRPRHADAIVQECGVGLVRLRAERGRLAFQAPALRRDGPVEPALRARVLGALGLREDDVRAMQWLDNGPPWIGVLLADARAVLALRPDAAALQGQCVGIVGPYPPGGECAVEVRAITRGGYEDPVTGSLNAGLGLWLTQAGVAPPHYVASQGTVLGRRGRVHVDRRGDSVWVGGDVSDVIEGRLAI